MSLSEKDLSILGLEMLLRCAESALEDDINEDDEYERVEAGGAVVDYYDKVYAEAWAWLDTLKQRVRDEEEGM